MPLLVVLSGPSGVGKDAVLARMRELGRPYHFTVTVTTRPKRPSEHSGVDYIFMNEDEFRELKEQGGLLEWAEVYGHLYGVPRAQIAQALAEGKDVLVKTDVQGAATLKGLLPAGIFIFLAPPSLEDLRDRLQQRGTEAVQQVLFRLQAAEREMDQLPLFTHAVVNESERLEQTIIAIEAIMMAEKLKVGRQKVEL